MDRVRLAISSVPPLSMVPPQVQKLFRDHVTETFNDFTPVVDVMVAKQEARDCSGTRGAQHFSCCPCCPSSCPVVLLLVLVFFILVRTRAGTHRPCSLRTSLARTGVAEAMRTDSMALITSGVLQAGGRFSRPALSGRRRCERRRWPRPCTSIEHGQCWQLTPRFLCLSPFVHLLLPHGNRKQETVTLSSRD